MKGLSSLPVFLTALLCLFFSVKAHATDDFITTWQVIEDGGTITIPTTGDGYNYNVDWGDGSSSLNQTGNATHVYTIAGTYQVSISGDFPRIFFNLGGDAERILSVDQWGEQIWASMENAFSGCVNLQINASDLPDLSNVASMELMFPGVLSFHESIREWDVSRVTNMSGMFALTFVNQGIGAWDVSSVTDMSAMFFEAPLFNQDIGGWDVSGVADMSFMFSGAIAFNQDISEWDVSRVADMSSMFRGAFNYSSANYESLLIQWSTLTLQDSVEFGFNSVEYCSIAAETARGVLINDFNWIVSDLGVCDADNDRLPDFSDNCPLISNVAQLDFDSDGTGDLCDSDDDNDGLPDTYEVANGLNPRNPLDRDADPDGDGFSNIEEFEFGSNPNVADSDQDNNNIPDSIENRIKITPIINLLLLDGAA